MLVNTVDRRTKYCPEHLSTLRRPPLLLLFTNNVGLVTVANVGGAKSKIGDPTIPGSHGPLVENMVTKEEIAQNDQFLLLPQCWPFLVIGYPFNFRDFLFFAATLLYEGKG